MEEWRLNEWCLQFISIQILLQKPSLRLESRSLAVKPMSKEDLYSHNLPPLLDFSLRTINELHEHGKKSIL